MPRMELAGATHVGRVRRNNEDCFALFPELNAAIVADGMGGAACGEVASAMTVDEVARLMRIPHAGLPQDQWIINAIHAANQRVWQAAHADEGCSGMGSTLVLAHWQNNHLWIANVGDSRAYRLRGGQLKQLSFDQNVANELRTSLGLTEQQISQYPYRNALTMAIGTAEKVVARLMKDDLQPGDVLLLCSDGLSGPVSDQRMADIVLEAHDLQSAVNELIDEANRNGGPDNVTVVLLRYTD
ncbi:MAG: serine/threonine-protein phosphatase [Bryobacterales bacterium]|nr:serine/threonine-protein phosphatase [Bryobacterales bacterium]